MPELNTIVTGDLYILFQTAIAARGVVLGWKREIAGKWAGLRTHMPVCLSPSMFIKVGEALIVLAHDSRLADALQTDPVRMVEVTMSGTAFLGAGVIFRDPGAMLPVASLQPRC